MRRPSTESDDGGAALASGEAPQCPYEGVAMATPTAQEKRELLPSSKRIGARGPRGSNVAILGALLVVMTVCMVGFMPSLQNSSDAYAVYLTTWPTAVEDGGDLVVHWHCEGDVSSHDYLTLSCGPQNGPDDYLQRRNVTELDATTTSTRFSGLYMMRCSYFVAYFQHDRYTQTFHVAATIEVGMRESFNVPKHGHLALTTQEDAMAIMFNSGSSRTPEVKYGVNQGKLDQHALGTSTTYNASDLCNAPANTIAQRLFRDPGFMHTVIMTNLVADNIYYYQYGNDVDGWSDVQQFRSRPARNARSAKFIAYGDMGVDGAPAASSNAVRVFSDVVGDGFDSFLLHFGDISYARGEGSIWDTFFHMIEPFATRVPYMVSVGNHEHDYTSGGEHDPSGDTGESGHGFHPAWGNYGDDSLGECSVPMYHRWHVPATGNSLFWYSFDYAGVHVVQMSSEHNWTLDSPQYKWLRADLARVNRTETPWIVLTAHRMMYSTQIGLDHDRRVAMHLREELEDLLIKYKVNLVLAGHQHSYERSCAVHRSECVDDGRSAPVHIVVGSAGFGLSTEGFSDKIGKWSVFQAQEYGRLRVATTAEQMHLEFVSNRNGIVLDSVTLAPY